MMATEGARQMGRAAALFISAGSLILAATGAASAALIDERVDYADDHGNGIAAVHGGDAPVPISIDTLPGRAEPLPLAGEGFAVAKLDLADSVVSLSHTSPNPVLKQAEEPASATTAQSIRFICGYIADSVRASPPPPASGDQYAVAIADATLRGFAQARDAQSGLSEDPHSSTAEISFDVDINIPADWAQPSQLKAYVNPVFHGAHYVESNLSPSTSSASSASTQQLIEFGWSRGPDEFMETLWDIRTSKSDGTKELTPYRWAGYEDDEHLVASMDITPDAAHTFTVRSRTTATSSPVLGAPAVAQIDYGSARLDGPNNGPNHWFHANKELDYFWIEYVLPPDVELVNC